MSSIVSIHATTSWCAVIFVGLAHRCELPSSSFVWVGVCGLFGKMAGAGCG